MSIFIEEDIREEFLSYFLTEDKDSETLMSEIDALKESTDETFLLESGLLGRVSNTINKKLTQTLVRDINSLGRIIDELEKQGGQNTARLKARRDALMNLMDRIKRGEASTSIALIHTIITYNKMLISIIAVIATITGVSALSITASTFGLESARTTLVAGFRNLTNEPMSDVTLADVRDLLSKLSKSGVDNKRINELSSAIEVTIARTARNEIDIAKLQAGIERMNGIQALKALEDKGVDLAKVAITQVENTILNSFLEKYTHIPTYMRWGRNVKKFFASPETVREVQKSSAPIPVDVTQSSPQMKELLKQQELLQKQRDVIKSSQIKLDQMKVENSRNLNEVFSVSVKVVAIAVVLSLALSLISHLLINWYAKKLTDDKYESQFKKIVRDAINKTRRAMNDVEKRL